MYANFNFYSLGTVEKLHLNILICDGLTEMLREIYSSHFIVNHIILTLINLIFTVPSESRHQCHDQKLV